MGAPTTVPAGTATDIFADGLLDSLWRALVPSKRLKKSAGRGWRDTGVLSRRNEFDEFARTNAVMGENVDDCPNFAMFSDPHFVIYVVNAGVQVNAYKKLYAAFPTFRSDPAVFRALQVSDRTVKRRLDAQDDARELPKQQAEQVVLLAGVATLAADVMGSVDAGQAWLSTASVALKGIRPLDMMETATGAGIVRDLLLQIQAGSFV
jgi:putative toxin-antitoxin system antitoxin component (TIGR02293 family)